MTDNNKLVHASKLVYEDMNYEHSCRVSEMKSEYYIEPNSDFLSA